MAYLNLNFTHEELEALFAKLDAGVLLEQEQYDKLINEIGLDNISTFKGSYKELLDAPVIPEKLSDLFDDLKCINENVLNEKMEVIEDKFIKAEELNDAKLELKMNRDECANLLENKISKEEFAEGMNVKANEVDMLVHLALKMDKEECNVLLDNKVNLEKHMEDLTHKLDVAQAEILFAEKVSYLDLANELSKKSDMTYVAEQLALKANVKDMEDALALKYNIADADALLAMKVDVSVFDEQMGAKANLAEMAELLDLKADRTELVKKANAAEMLEALELKADVSALNVGLAKKADIDYIDGMVNAKANKDHVHNNYALSGHTHTVSFNDLTNKPTILKLEDVYKYGTSRPSAKKGQCFFDTKLGKPIWFDGTNWVDATGTIV